MDRKAYVAGGRVEMGVNEVLFSVPWGLNGKKNHQSMELCNIFENPEKGVGI